MNFMRLPKLAGIGALALLLGLTDAGAQQPAPNPIARIRLSRQMTRPAEVQVNSNLRALQRNRDNWLYLDIQYETLPEWTDELKITYYVLIETGNPREPNVLLKGEESFVHIERGRHQDIALVHPNVLKRYGGQNRVKGIAVEFTYQGRAVAAEANPAAFDFRRAATVLAAKEGHVLPKARTPFAMVDADGFEMVKPEAPR